MSSQTGSTHTLVERADIHKSCKSLEAVVNVLNDYCEAANATVILQRKLSKALRESATMKCHPDIVADTFTASATVFESLTDVYFKFIKVADKECETLNTEVKRWFKKLAKEEKTHDEKIAVANAKIKQAGLNYEKKAKKAVRDATEEHTRYINFLSTLGPEMSEERYNHSLFVTQRHISTTCSVASCLARVADAEWLRHCEGVRRSAPSIGRLVECKSFCEGEWIGNLPQDLPNVNATSSRSDLADLAPSFPPVDDELLDGSSGLSTSMDQYRRAQDPYGESIPRRSVPRYNSPRLAAPVQFPTADDASDHSRGSEDRRTSLDHFPSPPTHFPIPPVPSNQSPTKQQEPEAQPDHVHQSPSPSHSTMPSSRKVSADDTHIQSRVDSYTRNNAAEQQSAMLSSTSDSRSSRDEQVVIAESPAKPIISQQPPDALSNVPEDPSIDLSASKDQVAFGATNLTEREFGVRGPTERVPVRAQTFDIPTTQTLQRSDSTRSSGSIVAAMRNRFAQNISAPPLSPTKQVASAVSVSNIASRYQSKANPVPEVLPPIAATRHEGLYTSPRIPELLTKDRGNDSGTFLGNNNTSSKYDDIAHRRKRLEQLEELEIREQQQQLKIKERDIEQRTMELERERARLFTATNAKHYANSNENLHGPVDMHPAGQRQQYGTHAIASTARYSYSTSHLVPPDSIQPQTSSDLQFRSASLVSPSIQSTSRSFAPYTSASPVEHLVRPQGNNKPRGWIRRLSMPVISSFESSKKSAGASQPWRTTLALPEGNHDGRLGRMSLDRDIYNGGGNQRIMNYRG